MKCFFSLSGPFFRILFFGLCFTYHSVLFGQEYSYKHYNSENALPQNSVEDIVTDSRGYLWFSTQAGITRFDGSEFVVINSSQIPSMVSDRIGWVGVDNYHNVYFKDATDGLFRQKAEGLEFEKVALHDSSTIRITGYENAHVSEIKKNGFLKRNALYPLMPNPLMNVQTSDGTSWTYYQDAKTNRFLLNFLSSAKTGNLTDDERIQDCLMLQFSDTLCFLNRSGKASFIINGKYLNNEPIETGITFDQKSRILHSASTNNYLIRDNNLYEVRFNPGLGLYLKIVIRDLPCNNIEVIYKIPESGIYAIGTSTDGLYLFYPKLFNTIIYSPNKTLSYTNSYAVTTKGDDVINTDYTYNLSNKKFQNHTDIVPFFLFKDGEGDIYYSKRADFNSAILFRTKDFIRSERIGRFSTELSAMESSLTDRKRLYFVSRTQIGYIENNKIEVLMDLPAGPVETSNLIMQCMLIEKEKILIGTDQGIFSYKLGSGQFSRVSQDSKFHIRNIYKDSQNNIFVGTYGHGPYLLTGDKLISLQLDPEKSLKYTHCFMEDGAGRLWITTNNGLLVVSRQNLMESARDKSVMTYYYSFDKISGLPGYEFNGGCTPCAARNDAGSLFFPSLKGIVSVNPEQVSLLYPDKKLYIDRIQIDDSTFYDFSENLLVPRDFSQLKIYVSTPYFGKSDNLKIEYFISQVQNVWLPVTGGKIDLKLLTPGEYTLKVRKLSIIDSKPAYIYNDLRFTVLPYWYETTIFKLICMVLASVLIWVGFQVRYRYIIRQNAVLEEKIAERSRSQQLLIESLELSYNNLQASENKLQNLLSDKENVFSILVHDLRSPLRYLHKNSAHLAKNWNNYSREELNDVITQLDCSTKEIHYFTEELMNWMSALDKNQPVEKDELSVAEVVDELALLYKEILNQNNNVLNNDVSRDLMICTNPFLLKTVLRNLIDNANKNTEHGHITIVAHRNNDQISITVSDDGTGMSDEMILKMNTYLRGVDEPSKVNSQFGHIIMKDALRSLEGTLEYSKTATTLNANMQLKCYMKIKRADDF